MKVIFSPHAFSGFEGTQEELDAFVKEIKDFAESGKLLVTLVPIDVNELEENDPELAEILKEALADINNDSLKRKLN